VSWAVFIFGRARRRRLRRFEGIKPSSVLFLDCSRERVKPFLKLGNSAISLSLTLPTRLCDDTCSTCFSAPLAGNVRTIWVLVASNLQAAARLAGSSFLGVLTAIEICSCCAWAD
jgi:hypothetical protein